MNMTQIYLVEEWHTKLRASPMLSGTGETQGYADATYESAQVALMALDALARSMRRDIDKSMVTEDGSGTVIMEDDENLCAKCKPAEPAPAEQGEELIKADKATESAIMLIDTLDMNGLAGTGGLLTREIRRLRALLAAERGRAERAEAVSEEEYSRGFNNGARASHSALVAIIEDKEKDIEVAEAEAKALREALTPSEITKAAYIGEFEFPVKAYDEDGEELTFPAPVPWTTIKEIMAAILARALDRSGKA